MALIGYARVSTGSQDLSAQVEALKNAGAIKIFKGSQSGKSEKNLKKLESMLEYVREGDVVLVTRLDRLGRSLNQILNTIHSLNEKGVSLKSLDNQIDTSNDSSMSTAMIQLLGMFAELEHSIATERLQSGRKRTGKLGGRPKLLSDIQIKEIKKRHKNGESISSLSRHFEVSRLTVSRNLDK